MYDHKRILAIVPARGGSKGVPLKNIRPICGIPLVSRVADVVREVGICDRVVVSTDDHRIKWVAEAAGLDVPFLRPEEIAGDIIGDLDVLTHALLETERLEGSGEYDIVLMLQPTSPMRRATHLIDCVKMLVNGGFDAVWTVSPSDSKAHPLKQLTVDENGNLDYYDPRGKQIIARQQLTPVYHRNGACYAITRHCLLNQKSIKGARAGAVVTEAMVSIDTLFDFRLVELLMSESVPTFEDYPLPHMPF